MILLLIPMFILMVMVIILISFMLVVATDATITIAKLFFLSRF